MLKKSTLEHIISEDLSDLWNILSPEEKRTVTDNFTILHYKKGQIIYAEQEEPENLWCLLKGKVKMYTAPCNISVTVPTSRKRIMCRRARPSSRRY